MNRLIVDTLRSVGLVKAGDDPEAKVMLFKSRTDIVPSEVEPPASGPTIAKETAVAEFDIAAIEDEGLRAAVSERITTLEAELAALAEPELVDVVKDAPPEIQAILKEQEERLAKTEAALAKELDARLEREAFAKAEALPFVGDTAELAGILKDVEVAEKLLPILTALNQRLSDSNLFKVLGVTDDQDADPITRRDAFVKEYVKEHDVTDAVARRAFWSAHPDLKEEARKDS